MLVPHCLTRWWQASRPNVHSSESVAQEQDVSFCCHSLEYRVDVLTACS